MGLAEVVERFLGHVARRGSARTRENYQWGLSSLLRFLGEHGIVQLEQLGEVDLEDWQDSILARGWAPRSRSLAHTAVRSWLRWLQDRDLVDWRLLRAVDPVPIPKGIARPIRREHLARILAELGPRPPDVVDERGDRVGPSVRELRDRALFHYLLTSSARISEALQLRRKEYEVALVTRKGGNLLPLLIPPTVRRMIDEYLELRSDDLEWLWVTWEPGKPVRLLSRDAANRAWIRLARRIGVPAWSSHRLRDTGGSYLRRRGVDTLQIADWLGHEDLETVAKYVEIENEQRLQVVALMEELVHVDPPPRFRPGIVGLRARGRGKGARLRRTEK